MIGKGGISIYKKSEEIDGREIEFKTILFNKFFALFLSHYYGDPQDIVDTIHIHVGKFGLRISYAHDGWIDSNSGKEINFKIEKKRKLLQIIFWKFAIALEIN